METSMNGNRDLDLFFAMLQKRARAIKERVSINHEDITIDMLSRLPIAHFKLFRNLPRDITIDILSRLPVASVMACKLVCRAWRDLIKSPEFGNSQSDRHRCLVVFPITTPYQRSELAPSPYKIEELNNKPISILHIGLFESVPLVRNSVNGLVLVMRRQWAEPEPEQQQQRQCPPLLWICNPITREYVRIPNPSDRDFEHGLPSPVDHRHFFTRLLYMGRHPRAPPEEYGKYSFGFGVSRASMQYKVVWITQSECRVFDLGGAGTGRWRPGPRLLRYYNNIKWNTECAFVGGNLYWMDPQTGFLCFDLEAEVFTYLRAPPTRRAYRRSVSVFEECLCLCDTSGFEIEIWLMRGGEWSKKLALDEQGDFGKSVVFDCCWCLFPIKEDGNGGILLGTRCNDSIHCYSRGRIVIQYPNPKSPYFPLYDYEYPRAAVYTPSFLPLKTLLPHEDVRSF